MAAQLPEDRQIAVRQVLGGAIVNVIKTAFTHLQCLDVGDRPAVFVNVQLESYRPSFDQGFTTDANQRSFAVMFSRHPMQFAYFDELKAQAERENLDDPIVDRSCAPRVANWTAVKSEAIKLAMNTPDDWRLDTTLGSSF